MFKSIKVSAFFFILSVITISATLAQTIDRTGPRKKIPTTKPDFPDHREDLRGRYTIELNLNSAEDVDKAREAGIRNPEQGLQYKRIERYLLHELRKSGLDFKIITEPAEVHFREEARPHKPNSSNATTGITAVSEQDSLALVALYNSTNGDNWTDNTNWLSANPVSTWEGVTVEGGRVTGLNLYDNNLIGTIPPEIGNLINLTYLGLADNQLSGSIPPEIGNLTNLIHLGLDQNQLNGEIPPEIGNLINLVGLYLLENQLSGEIPPEIGNLSNLEDIDLSTNQLSGSIPAEIGNLLNLDDMRLSTNQLNGSIPEEIGNLSQLYYLFLVNNQLSGPIPPEIGNLTNLHGLSLFNNQLSGEIPASIGNLTNLEFLTLGVNKLEGSFPEIGNLTSLQSMHLHVNKITGLPDLSSLPELGILLSQNNQLTFEDLEYNIGIIDFQYSPQAKVGQTEEITRQSGASVTFTVTVGGTANQYQWYKDGTAISGATSASFTMNNLVPNDAGAYTCRITNTIATELTLESYPQNLIIDDNAIITIISPNGGETWTAGGTHEITWSSANTSGNVYLECHVFHTSTIDIYLIASNTDDDGSFSWTIPGSINSSSCTIYIRDIATTDVNDWSDAYFTIAPPVSDPILAVDPTTLDFGSSLTSLTFDVSNSGSGDLYWNVSESESWITSISPSSGTNDGTVTVTVNRDGLSSGNYTGTVMVTSNGGNIEVTVYMSVSDVAGLWEAQQSGTANTLYYVDAVSKDVSWVAGGYQVVLRTINGGAAWSDVWASDAVGIYCVSAIDNYSAFAASNLGNTGHIYRTTNGGSSWTKVYEKSDVWMSHMMMLNQNEGIAIGTPADGAWTILKTTNGGGNWQQMTGAPSGAFDETIARTAVIWLTEQEGWFAVSNRPKSFHTTNGGASWTEVSCSPLPHVRSIEFNRNQPGTGLAAADYDLARTTNNGANWQVITPPAAGLILHITYYQGAFWMLIEKEIYKSMDNGSTWELQYTADNSLRQCEFTTDMQGRYGWAVGDNGTILKYENDDVESIVISCPNLTGEPGSTVNIPINITDVTGQGVYSVELTVETQTDVLTPLSATTTGTITESWGAPTFGINGGTIDISMAGASELSGTGSLVIIAYEVNSSATIGQTTPIDITHAKLNEGQPFAISQDGLFTIASGFDISGAIKYYNNDLPLANVILRLDGEQATTNASGSFNFAGIPGGNYTLKPSKDGELGSSISAYDASMILRYTVGTVTLTPYQMVAADVSGNGGISAYDASYILRYTVGTVTEFPAGGDWTFVPASFSINETNWNLAPDSLIYRPLNSDLTNQDFFGIVYGDVSGNWTPSGALLAQVPKSYLGSATVRWGELNNLPSQQLSAPLKIDLSGDLISAQFKIQFDPQIVNFKSIEFNELLKDFHAEYNLSLGELTVALAGAEPISSLDDLASIQFELEKLEDGSNKTIELKEIMLNEGMIAVNTPNPAVSLNPAVPTTIALFQNYPNPFNPTTTIRYALPKALTVALVFYNLTGQRIKHFVTQNQAPGVHQIQWDGTDDSGRNVAGGIYIYKIQAGEFQQSRKMILLR